MQLTSIDENKYSTDLSIPPQWVLNERLEGGRPAGPLWNRLIPFFKYLSDDSVTELVVNKPHEILVERGGTWEKHEAPELDYSALKETSGLIASWTQQNIDEVNPILSSTLPTGERIQICGFSSVLAGRFSFTIRKPSNVTITLEEYVLNGYFDNTEWVSDVDIHEVMNSRLITQGQKELALALHEKRWYDFFCGAIEHKQNILLSGSTGSGKTTFMKALVQKVPQDERLLSIENVDELGLYKSHDNTVPLFYSSGGQGISKVTQGDLLVSALRMRPDRVFCAELLEGNEAFYYLRNIGSGHPGSITTMHANTAHGAKEQLVIFIKESDAGNSLAKADIISFLDKTVDIIMQVNKIHNKRSMTQIDFDPLRPYRKPEDTIAKELKNLVEASRKRNDNIEAMTKLFRSFFSIVGRFFGKAWADIQTKFKM